MSHGYTTFPLASVNAQIAALTTRVAALEANQLLNVEVNATSAQILNSASAPITLVPAPGVGNYIQVFSVIARSTFGTIPYATNLNCRIRLGNANANMITFPNNTLLGQSVTATYQFGYTTLVAGSETSPSNIALIFSTGTGNPTAGNGTIDFYVSYKIITTF